jgi:hypothetical protein
MEPTISCQNPTFYETIKVEDLKSHRIQYQNEGSQLNPTIFSPLFCHGQFTTDHVPLTTDKFYPSCRFNISFTNFGLALTFVSFMTWPTKNPNN